MGSTVLTQESVQPVAIVAQIIKRTQDGAIAWERVEARGVNAPIGISGNVIDAYRGVHAKTGMTLLLTTFLDPPKLRGPEDRRVPVLDLINDNVQVDRIMGLQVLNDLESIVR